MGAIVTIHHTSSSPDDTARFAARIAAGLRAGDTLLLSGQLGAGKSHFARAAIRARLGDPHAEVPSPSYTLVQSYMAGDVEIWHADLYRLTGSEEVPELGLDAAFETAICMVEWPDRLGPWAPETAIAVTFRILDDSVREIAVNAPASRAADLSDLVERQNV